MIPYNTFRRTYAAMRMKWASGSRHIPNMLISPWIKLANSWNGAEKCHTAVRIISPLGPPNSRWKNSHNIMRMVVVATVVLSSIGLLIGGVGVMNIMLVSVTERTREIGVRKAIGAKSKDITWQFLLEAMTLTGTGGILALVLVTGLVLLIKLTLKWPGSVPWWATACGITVSVLYRSNFRRLARNEGREIGSYSKRSGTNESEQRSLLWDSCKRITV